MTQPSHSQPSQSQPSATESPENLVEPEGVNAGSDVPEPSAETAAAEDVTGGGFPHAPEPSGADAAEELPGVPDGSPQTPGQELSVGEG